MLTKNVSVLIPTYKRADLLNHVLKSLANQTYRDFEVLVVFKPSEDNTEAVVEKYAGSMKIRGVRQAKGHVVDALNLGLKNATGDIIAFLDDDAIPASDWIQRYVETYDLPNVGGVAGNVIPSSINGGKLVVGPKSSEVIPDCRPFMMALSSKLWSRPLEGQEDYLVYISKAGMVDHNFRIGQTANDQITKSLLGMGANMSVLAKAVKGFQLPNSWVLGLSYEQYLGWYIWKKGFNVLFNPKIKVYHLSHGQTLTRQVTERRRQALRRIEAQLLFYRLYLLEPNLSYIHRVTWLAFVNLLALKKICLNRQTSELTALANVLRPELMGLKWNLSRRLGGDYNPLNELERFNSGSQKNQVS